MATKKSATSKSRRSAKSDHPPGSLTVKQRKAIDDLLARYPLDVVEQCLPEIRARLKDELSGSAPEDPRRLLRAECKRDLNRFAQEFFSHYFSEEFGPLQKELFAMAQAYGTAKSRRSPIKTSVAIPRGFGKSTIMTLIVPIWLVCAGVWRFPVIISSNRALAVDFLRYIIAEVEQNDKLTDYFPELLPQIDNKGQTVSWKDDDIVMSGGARFIARGFGNSIRGQRNRSARPDALLIDDPDEEKDVASEATMKRKIRWFERAALRLGSGWGCDVLMAYTTVANNCIGEYIYNHKERYLDWQKIKKGAMRMEKGEWVSNWPTNPGFTTEILLAEKAKDPLMFAQEMMNDPLPEEDQKFKGHIQTYEYAEIRSFEGWRLALAVDLSLGKSEKSDYSAIIGVGMSPGGQYREVYSSISRRRPTQIKEELFTVLSMLPWDICGIEDAGNQDHFVDLAREDYERHNAELYERVKDYKRMIRDEPARAVELQPVVDDLERRRYTVPIVGIPTSGDKIRRIVGSLEPLITTGTLRLRSDSEMLIGQLSEFPHGFKDGPDALEMAVQLIRRYDDFRPKQAKVAEAYVPERKLRTGGDVHKARHQRMMRGGMR